MSNRKNYNSIVFLTTLSVYLGLVLVGAPPVLAQAALTQKIEIKNEAEIKDDLDKKPDEDLFASYITNLVGELKDFSEKGLFDWNSKNELKLRDLGICQSGDDLPSYLAVGAIGLRVDNALKKTADKIARNLCRKIHYMGLGDLQSQGAEFDFVLADGTLDSETRIYVNSHYEKGIYVVNSHGNVDVRPFVDELSRYLTEISSSSKPAVKKIIAENTKVTFQNNQIFIVIRLPRASIDEFLAKKDAQ